MQSRRRTRLSGYAVALMFGSILCPLFKTLEWMGAIRVRGRERAFREIRHGNVVIAANHPTLLETFLIPLMFTPRGLFNERYFVWSMPDKRLFGRLPVYNAWRCITVDRNRTRKAREHNKLADQKAGQMLREGYSIVVHPEGGRTSKGASLIERNGRSMRPVSVSPVKLAYRTGGRVLPIWVAVADGMQRDLPGFGRLFLRLLQPKYWPIELRVGHAYGFCGPFDRLAERDRLQRAIFDAFNV